MVPKQPQQLFCHLNAATIRVSTHLPGDAAWPDDESGVVANQWLKWITDVWRRPSVAAAITVASPVLADRVVAVLNSSASCEDADLRRLGYSLARYLVRMEGRATPFGLFAGVVPLAFGGMSIRLGEDHHSRTRCDSSWISAIINRLERSSAVRARLMVIRNDLCFVRGDRLVIPWQPHASTQHTPTEEHAGSHAVHRRLSGQPEQRTLRIGPAVHAILHAAVAPAAIPDVINAASGADRSKPTAYYDALVTALVEAGALITSLRPTGTTPDVLEHVLGELDRSGAADLADVADLVQQLRRVQALMREADQQYWASTEVRAQLRSEMLFISAVADQPTVVDLRHDGTVSLPTSVIDEAIAAAEVLMRLGAGRNAHWAAYHDTFVARYGFGALVPVRELTDPTDGLGFPAHFAGAHAPGPVTSRDALLLRLAQQAVMDGCDELIVDEQLLQMVEASEPRVRRLRPTST